MHRTSALVSRFVNGPPVVCTDRIWSEVRCAQKRTHFRGVKSHRESCTGHEDEKNAIPLELRHLEPAHKLPGPYHASVLGDRTSERLARGDRHLAELPQAECCLHGVS